MRAPRRGRLRWQRVYRRLHRLALDGLNYGQYELNESGESWALEWAAKTHPAARVVFDVGANVGTWSLRATDAWPQAQIYAFEPSPDVHRKLTGNVAGRRIVPIHAAMSDRGGTARLYQVEGITELASLHRRDLTDFGLSVSEGPAVPTVTLDEFCAENSLDRVDYLKVDTEGHELAVFNGAQQSLRERRIGVVQFEFGGTDIDSRTFLRDFVRLFEPTHVVHRLVRDGMEPLNYSEHAEVFVTSHFLAVPRPLSE